MKIKFLTSVSILALSIGMLAQPTFAVDDLPSPPTNLHLIKQTPFEVKLGWDAPLNPGSPTYGVHLQGSPDGGISWLDVDNWDLNELKEPSTDSHWISSLDVIDPIDDRCVNQYREIHSGTTYLFRIATINEAEVTGPYSAEISVTTPTGAPQRPSFSCVDNGLRLTGVKVRGKSNPTIFKMPFVVHWVKPVDDGGSPIKGYKIQYRQMNSKFKYIGKWISIPDVKAGARKSPIPQLLAGKMWNIRVAAVNSLGTGRWQFTGIIKTLKSGEIICYGEWCTVIG